MSASVIPFGSVNQFDGVSSEARLRDIALFAIGSKEADAAESTEIKGGRGRIGIIDGRVVKFNTHTLERSGGPKADKAMYDSCNALRRTLVDIARGLGVGDNSETMRRIRDLLKMGEDGTVPPKRLLNRTTVAKVVNLLGAEKNTDYWASLTERQVKRVASTGRDMHFGTVGADMRRQALDELAKSGASDGSGPGVIDNIIREKFDEVWGAYDPVSLKQDPSWKGSLWLLVNRSCVSEGLPADMKAKRWQMMSGLMREFVKAEVREVIVKLVADRTCKDAAEAWESIVWNAPENRRSAAFEEIMKRSAIHLQALLGGFDRLWGDGSANDAVLARKVRNGLGMQLMPLLMGPLFDDMVRPKTNMRAQAIVEAMLDKVRSFVQSQKDVSSLESLSLPELYRRICKWAGKDPVSPDRLGKMNAPAIRDEIRTVFYSWLPRNPPVVDVNGPIDDVTAVNLKDSLFEKIQEVSGNQSDYMLYEPFVLDVVRGSSVRFDNDVTIEAKGMQYGDGTSEEKKRIREGFARVFNDYFEDEALAGLAAILCNQILSTKILSAFWTGMLRGRMMVNYDGDRGMKWTPFEVKRRKDGDFEVSCKEERPVTLVSQWQTGETGIGSMLPASQQQEGSHFKGELTLRIGKVDKDHPLPDGAMPVTVANKALYVLVDRDHCTYDVKVVAKSPDVRPELGKRSNAV